jgi:hypothetical protein
MIDIINLCLSAARAGRIEPPHGNVEGEQEASVPVPTFESRRGGFVYECQNQRDTSTRLPKIVIRLRILANELRKARGTSRGARHSSRAARLRYRSA